MDTKWSWGVFCCTIDPSTKSSGGHSPIQQKAQGDIPKYDNNYGILILPFLLSTHYMKYFLSCFTVFVVIQTLREHWLLSGSIGFLLISVFMILRLFKKLSWKGLFLGIGGLICAGGSMWRYSHIAQDRFSEELRQEYVGSGVIVNTQGVGKYLYQDHQGVWVLQREQETLDLGSSLLVVGTQKNIIPFSSGSGTNLWSKLRAPSLLQGTFDYNRWLFMKGYHGVLYAKQVIEVDTLAPSDVLGATKYRLVYMRNILFERLDGFFGDTKYTGLLRGLLLGDRAGIPSDDYQNFIDSGLVHIVAVSGGNMIMLVLLLHILFFFLPYYMRLGVVLCGLLGYGLLCGLDSSVLRALIMGCITLLALFSGRVISVWRLMSYAWIAMLLLNPYVLLYDMGFLLSFGALAGIVLFQKISHTRASGLPRSFSLFLQKYVFPTFGANLGVLPVLIFFTGTMNIISFLGNIVILPFVPLMMLGGGLGLALGPYLSWTPFIMVETWLLKCVYMLATWSAHVGVYVNVSSVLSKGVIVLGLLAIYQVIYRRAMAKNKCIVDDTPER